MTKHINIPLHNDDLQGRQNQRPPVKATSANILNYIKMLNETQMQQSQTVTTTFPQRWVSQKDLLYTRESKTHKM